MLALMDLTVDLEAEAVLAVAQVKEIHLLQVHLKALMVAALAAAEAAEELVDKTGQRVLVKEDMVQQVQ